VRSELQGRTARRKDGTKGDAGLVRPIAGAGVGWREKEEESWTGI
jgi:hypothetical protein